MRYKAIIFLAFSCFSIVYTDQSFPLYDFSAERNWMASDSLSSQNALYAEFAPTMQPVPLSEKLMVDYKPDQPNPLLNQKPLLLRSLIQHHLLIIESKPADMYLIDTKPQAPSLLSVNNLKDATQNIAAGIMALDIGATTTDEQHFNGYFFAAVKPHTGNFGDVGSGVAVVKIATDVTTEKIKDKDGKEEEKTTKKVILSPLDTVAGTLNGNRAYPIDARDTNDNPISINGGLASIDPTIADVFWSPMIGRLYVSLAVRTKHSAATDQGACAILVGAINDDKLEFKPIATAFTGNNQIVGATGPDQTVSIHKTRVLFTSTGLTYLVIIGGNGTPADTKKLISALPIIDTKGHHNPLVIVTANQGLLANTKSRVTDREPAFRNSRRNAGSTLKNYAEQPDQLYTCDDSAVKVGASGQLPGPITDLICCSDAVYVSVSATDETPSGIFYSQPIFDCDGFIAAWTPWKRVAISDGTIFRFNVNIQTGSLKFFETDADNIVRFHKTVWAHEDNDLVIPVTQKNYICKDPIVQFLNAEFGAQKGGLAGLYSYDKNKLHNVVNTQNNLLVALGTSKKICLLLRNENKHKEVESLLIQDQGLQELGPLTCADIVSNENDTWLAIGGAYGVAVLQKNGAGWKTKEGLLNISLLNEYLFKKIIDCRFLKKLAYDAPYLYVLTRDNLYRCQIGREEISKVMLSPVIAAAQINAGSFVDMGISNGAILLAGTNGLFYSDIIEESADGTIANSFQLINLPNNYKQITKLSFVTTSGTEKDFEKKGQVYVLVGSTTNNFSAVYRLFVDGYRIEVLPDSYFKGVPGPFMHFANYRSVFANNGFISLSGAERYRHEPFLQIETSGIAAYKVPLNKYITNVHFKNNSTISAIVQDSVTGNWLIAGDFGVYSHPWIVA